MPDTITTSGADIVSGSTTAPADQLWLGSTPITLPCPSGKAFAAYKAAAVALNDGYEDDQAKCDALADIYFKAQEEFVNTRDATALGTVIKLRLLAEVEDLDGELAEHPNLLWPRIIKRVIADLSEAVGLP